MDGPLEVDVRGKGTHHEPRYYVITDRMGRVICDTLNVWQFDEDEQCQMMHDLAGRMNRSLANLYDPVTVLREVVEDLDRLNDIPVSGAAMSRARQVIAQQEVGSQSQ